MPSVMGKLLAPNLPPLLDLAHMTLLESSAIGWFFGFFFGVGCALAVMYSIYMGGYRAAVKDSQTNPPPERLVKELAKLSR